MFCQLPKPCFGAFSTSDRPMWAELQRHHALLHGEDAYLADFTKDARNGHAVQRHSLCDQELGF